MKQALILATALGTLTALTPAAMAQTYNADAISIHDFVGTVQVRATSASQISVQIQSGSSDHSDPSMSVQGGRLMVDGGQSIRGLRCNSRNGSIRVGRRFGDRDAIADYPTLIIEAPASLALAIEDSIFVGRAGELGSANLSIDRCGDFEVAGISGDANIEINGSGDIAIGRISGGTRFDINGSGDIDVESVRDIHMDINGSGDIEIGTQTGEFTAQINGSGDIDVDGGRAQPFNVEINGSGDVHHGGEVVDAVVDINGSGDVTADEFSGSMHWRGPGSYVRSRP